MAHMFAANQRDSVMATGQCPAIYQKPAAALRHSCAVALLSVNCAASLVTCRWPGNVRELEPYDALNSSTVTLWRMMKECGLDL